jgi:hypothetical protein
MNNTEKTIMTQSQKDHMAQVKIAIDRALVWEKKAMAEDLPIMSNFWNEVAHMLTVGAECQERAMREKSLLTQAGGTTEIETEVKTIRGLFDGKPSTEKT